MFGEITKTIEDLNKWISLFTRSCNLKWDDLNRKWKSASAELLEGGVTEGPNK